MSQLWGFDFSIFFIFLIRDKGRPATRHSFSEYRPCICEHSIAESDERDGTAFCSGHQTFAF